MLSACPAQAMWHTTKTFKLPESDDSAQVECDESSNPGMDTDDDDDDAASTGMGVQGGERGTKRKRAAKQSRRTHNKNCFYGEDLWKKCCSKNHPMISCEAIWEAYAAANGSRLNAGLLVFNNVAAT